MRSVVAYLKRALSFAFLGAIIGAPVAYATEHWGTNAGMLQALLDPQSFHTAYPMVAGFLSMAFFSALPLAFVTGLVACLVAKKVGRWLSFPVFTAACAIAGAAVAFAAYSSNEFMGAPVSTAAAAALCAGAVLRPKLLKWLSPVSPVAAHQI